MVIPQVLVPFFCDSKITGQISRPREFPGAHTVQHSHRVKQNEPVEAVIAVLPVWEGGAADNLQFILKDQELRAGCRDRLKTGQTPPRDFRPLPTL